MKDLNAVSANRLNKFLECPFKLALYNFEVEGRPTDDKFLKCGLAVHKWIEDIIARDGVGSNGKKNGADWYFDEYEVPEELRGRFNTCVTTATEKLFPKYGKVEAEKVLQMYFENGSMLKVEARADLIDEEGVIWDWKTGKELNKPEYILQGQLYCHVFGSDKCIFISLLTGEEFEIKSPPEGYIRKLLQKYHESVKEGNLPKKSKYDDACIKRCEYYNICLNMEV